MTDSEMHRYPSDGVSVTWDAQVCRHFAVCVRQLPAVFDTSQRPWVQPGNADPALVVATVRSCPSGALQLEAGEAAGALPSGSTAGH
jgi:uncharacterized Fe-S cluster protein YjdI